ncbi:hypothetical protein J4410_03890 [Candidatus Woesearchaeota archaeon]|nr:hypothetical protein [Candidatus Woesearchaeota archaeon]
MQIHDSLKRQEMSKKITRIVQSWVQDMLHDVEKAIRDLQNGSDGKAKEVIHDFIAKDEKELVLIEAQVRLDEHDQGLLRQNSDVITLKQLAELALLELDNKEEKAALVLLQKMQMLAAEVEEVEMSML